MADAGLGDGARAGFLNSGLVGQRFRAPLAGGVILIAVGALLETDQRLRLELADEGIGLLELESFGLGVGGADVIEPHARDGTVVGQQFADLALAEGHVLGHFGGVVGIELR